MARGRKSEYRDEYSKQAYKLCLLGATDKQLADFFGVSERTVNTWKRQYPDFLRSLKEGKREADAKVAESLYHRAIGYECKATKFATFNGKITDTKDYIEHYPPDPTSIIFWLKNREPALWRDKPGDPIPEGQSDGFVDALSGIASKDWEGGEDG